MVVGTAPIDARGRLGASCRPHAPIGHARSPASAWLHVVTARSPPNSTGTQQNVTVTMVPRLLYWHAQMSQLALVAETPES
ncbi:hypothetical protein CLV28_1356 [Sediminihabitans luteus]|uniref:Uncharacterized protein n=2 Tax=Sediminihabitans luteus TaxID=1138585 RepID=A0A2M9CPR0_9CELL|nr:hypothetical protein CLV28_1356 [Sediminihabitans luteus]